MIKPREFWIELDELSPNIFFSKPCDELGPYAPIIHVIEKSAADKLAEALDRISKNQTMECDIYTMGCDCHEVAIEALKEYRGDNA